MSKNYVKSFLMGLFVASFLAFAMVASATVWHVPGDFETIQEAIDSESVVEGDKIMVGPGEHFGAIVDKAVEIKGEDGAVIVDGPPYRPDHPLHFGFKLYGGDQAGSGCTISHLTFRGGEIGDTRTYLAFPVFSYQAHDVTIEHCTMTNPIQGITNWEGNGWNISHNVIDGLLTECGGGIGIFIGCFGGATASDNLVAHNKITGHLVVAVGDCGGYSGPGIGLMSDRRGGSPGGEISRNRIIKNNVSLSSTDPENVPCVGIELTDMALELLMLPPDLLDNKVGFNDVRGVTGEESIPIALNPANVADYNKISRNLGGDANNRGHGLHPRVFLK